jgi:hypothetical protein
MTQAEARPSKRLHNLRGWNDCTRCGHPFGSAVRTLFDGIGCPAVQVRPVNLDFSIDFVSGSNERRVPRKAKKADVVEHLEVFVHVGLLVNKPPSVAGCSLLSHPTKSIAGSAVNS